MPSGCCVWKHWAQWSAWCKAPRAAGVSREGTGPGHGSSSQLNVSVPKAQASAFLAGRSQELSDMLAASCVMQADAGLRPPHAGAGPASPASPATGVGGHAQPWSILLAWLSWLLSSAAPQPGGNQVARVVSFPSPWGQGHSAPGSWGLPTSPTFLPEHGPPGAQPRLQGHLVLERLLPAASAMRRLREQGQGRGEQPTCCVRASLPDTAKTKSKEKEERKSVFCSSFV